MKTILVPVEATDLSASILEAAYLLARRFESYVEGFALSPALTGPVPVDAVGGAMLPIPDWPDEEMAGRAGRLFEGFMRDHGVPRFGGAAGLSFGWLDEAPQGDVFVGSYGRAFDVTVVGRPAYGWASPRMSTLETALFESGRPILIAPPATPQQIGETPMIAWNGSTETARSTAFAMPLLGQARRVVVLTVEGGLVPGPTGEQLARCLRLNGVAAEAISVAPGKQSTGEAILSNAASLGCDLVIKGAYTQSRLRQMIFGGATSHILDRATLPVFMAH